LTIRSRQNRVTAEISASALRLNQQGSINPSHLRRQSGLEPNSASNPRDSLQNEVKIEEYESDGASGKGSRSNSIRFVILKDDVMFANPKTPELKAVLKRQVVLTYDQYPNKNLDLAKALKMVDSQDDQQVVYNKQAEELGGTNSEGYSPLWANKNIPHKPSKFQRTATAKSPKSHSRSGNQEGVFVPDDNSSPNRLMRMYSPQNKKRKFNDNTRNFAGNGDHLNDSIHRSDSISSGKIKVTQRANRYGLKKTSTLLSVTSSRKCRLRTRLSKNA
jgi:hypothetical protein